MHGHHVSVTARISLLVSLSEVVKIVSTQVERSQMVQLTHQLVSFQLIQHLSCHELLLRQEQFERCNIVVHPGGGIMTHVEAFSHLLYAKDANIKRQFSIDILGCLLEVYLLLLPIYDVSVIKLQTHRNAIAEGMDSLVCPTRSRPLDSAKVLHVGLKDETILTKNAMNDVLDSVFRVTLVLKTKEFLSIVAKEDAHLYLETLAAASRFSLHVIMLIDYNNPFLPIFTNRCWEIAGASQPQDSYSRVTRNSIQIG